MSETVSNEELPKETEPKAVEAPVEEPANPTEDQKLLQTLQNDFLRLCAQAGEKQFLVSLNRRELLKINRQLKKINLKANGVIKHQQMVEEAKQKASQKLRVVPNDAV